jgi:hypothetical protein
MSIICENDEQKCYLCGRQSQLERHHTLHGGANRRLADEDGLWVWLCHQCHTDLHDRGEGDRELQALAEKKWIEWNYPNDEERGRTEFIKRYGKSYSAVYRDFITSRFMNKQ